MTPRDLEGAIGAVAARLASEAAGAPWLACTGRAFGATCTNANEKKRRISQPMHTRDPRRMCHPCALRWCLESAEEHAAEIAETAP